MAPKRKKSDHKQELGYTDLLRIIENGGELPLEDRLRLLHCGQPACPPGCKGGRKDNPECLCGLIPEEGRFKKSGLFQKTPALLGELGIDPSAQRRPVSSLGTCASATFRLDTQPLHGLLCCPPPQHGRHGITPITCTHRSAWAAHLLLQHMSNDRHQIGLWACATWATPAMSMPASRCCTTSGCSGMHCCGWSLGSRGRM